MIRFLVPIALAGALAYWTVGWATLHVLHGWFALDFRTADRAALFTFLAAWPLIYLGAGWLYRTLFPAPGQDVLGSFAGRGGILR